MKRKWFSVGAAVLFAGDQIIKSYAEQNMEKGEEKEMKGPVVLRRVENRGLPLNLLSDRPKLVRWLSAAAAGIVTVMHVFSLMRKGCIGLRSGLALLTAGAWSNTFDRFARGYVVDYIGFRCKNEKVSRITYNLGDFFIGAGAVLFLLSSLFTPKDK